MLMIAIGGSLPRGVQAQVDRQRGGVAEPYAFAQRYAVNSASPANLAWVPDPAGSGRTVLLARVHETDAKVYGGIRTEISAQHEYVKSGVRWYALSMYFPGDWQFHPYPTVVAQLHTSQKTTIVSPPVALVVHDHSLDLELNFNLRKIDGPDPVTKANSSRQRLRLDRLKTQQWYCFVVRADWSSSPGSGALKIWMNGDKVYEATNSPNAYETWLGNWPKVGLYIPGMMGVTQRSMFMDFIHVGGPRSGFEEMAALTPCGVGVVGRESAQ
ncbi:polysaccharide lyase [Denitromonas sp.]|uniref:polysaccharide lyase n=1 Tax=Denitromonas sp. TaxID=2734609 RepID=UPI002AFE6691|nr:polysaccharide lyase [Denitromonas sp.]